MRFLFSCLFLIFTSTTFAQQSYSCPSCAGSGSTYQTRKVPSFTTETYEAYGSLPGMVRKVSSYTYYQEEGGYAACLRCGGSGRLTYTKHPTTITPRKKTKKAEYSKAHYIMKVYNKKYDYKKNKIVQLDVPGGNIHLVTYYKSGDRKRDLVASKGKTFSIIVADEHFSNYDIVYDENQKFQFLKVDNDHNTTIYDANGRKIKQFSGRMYSAKNNLIWVENKDLRDAYYKNILQKGYYQLVDYKTNKAVIDGNYKINLSLKCKNLFNKKGIIDVKKVDPFTGEVKLGFVNRKGETIIPFQHSSVYDCEQSDRYVDLISTQGELLSYDVQGNLLSPTKGKLSDCGKGVKCFEYKVATQTQIETQKAPEKLIRLVAPDFPAINGRQFTEFHGFNEKGWARAKNKHSDYYLIHTSGFIAFDDNNISYENFTTPKIAIATLSSEREKTGKTDYFAEKQLENFEKIEKKGKIGAKYMFSYFINKTHEKKFKIPTNYKSVRPLEKNTIAVEDFNGKWGLYILKEKNMYEVAPQFDELLCYSTLVTYGKKGGNWYEITAFFGNVQIEVLTDRKKHMRDKHAIAYMQMGTGYEEIKSLLRDKVPPKKLAADSYVTVNDGKKIKTFEAVLPFEETGYSFAVRSQYFLPYKNAQGKWNFMVFPRQFSKAVITHDKPFVQKTVSPGFDEILYDKDGNNYFKNKLGIFKMVYREQHTSLIDTERKLTPVPIVLF